jgi:hypothetical protein
MKQPMTIAVAVEPPQVPNFIRAGANTIPVADLTDGQIEELIALWADALRRHVIARRAERDRQTTDALRRLTNTGRCAATHEEGK